MRLFITFTLIFLFFECGYSKLYSRLSLGVPVVTEAFDPPEEKWFIQPLDHFSPVDGHVWNQVKKFFIL